MRARLGTAGLPIEAYVLEPSPACYFFDRIEGNLDAIEAWKKARPLNDKELDTLSVHLPNIKTNPSTSTA